MKNFEKNSPEYTSVWRVFCNFETNNACFMDTQEREQNIYDFFQRKAMDGGITTDDFSRYLEENPDVNNDDEGMVIITQPDARFRKIVGEFSDILTKQREGRKYRYFLGTDVCRESLYHRHIGFKSFISNHLGKKGFSISYKKYNSDETNTVEFYPEYKRIYNDEFYIYGIAIDNDGCRFDIVKNARADNNLPFTQLNVNLITRIEILKDKKFVKTFADSAEWNRHFEYVLGVDPILNREPEEVVLYVKDEFRNRFEKQPLAKFKISEEKSEKKGYSLLTLKIKQNKELERKLLSYGSDVLVCKPEKIRKVIAKEIKKLNEFYSE